VRSAEIHSVSVCFLQNGGNPEVCRVRRDCVHRIAAKKGRESDSMGGWRDGGNSHCVGLFLSEWRESGSVSGQKTKCDLGFHRRK
jgi:hypothetical protein